MALNTEMRASVAYAQRIRASGASEKHDKESFQVPLNMIKRDRYAELCVMCYVLAYAERFVLCFQMKKDDLDS